MAVTPKERAGRPEEGLSPKGSVSVDECGLVSVTRLPGGCSSFLPAQTKGWNRTEMITHVEKRARKQTLAAPSADGQGLCPFSSLSTPNLTSSHLYRVNINTGLVEENKRKGWASISGFQPRWPCSCERDF